ncbi:hypothetical protein [Pseudomonas sp. GZD-209]|uniref:hypothetical protein n=1 Tax=Pseudomonas sp. GZD-209 TaxID=3404807 RepID=UPI003BB71FC1
MNRDTLKALAARVMNDRRFCCDEQHRFLAEGVLALFAENEALRKDAERYLVLRQADVDTIQNGGLFAGLVPDNIVINGHDLDRRTDAVIAARKEAQP